MKTNDTTDLAKIVFSQLNTDPKDSKKFIAAFGGAICLIFVFIVAGVLFVVNPKEFGQFSGIVMMTIPAIAGLAMAYLGGQAAVEYKANAVLQSSASPLGNGQSLPVKITNTPKDPANVKESNEFEK